MAFKECFNQANPQLLEPISKIQIKVPEDLIGTVMGIAPSHRGMVQGMETDRRFTYVNVLVPDAEIHGFVTDIKTQTQGRAKLTLHFSHFELVSKEIQKQVVSALKQEDAVEI
jgi:elongation factor G